MNGGAGADQQVHARTRLVSGRRSSGIRFTVPFMDMLTNEQIAATDLQRSENHSRE